MSLRRRIALVCAGAAAAALVLSSVLTYLLTSQQVHRQIDSQLRSRGHDSHAVMRLIAASPPGSTVRKLLRPSPTAVGPRPLRGLAGFPPGAAPTRAANPFRSLPQRPDQVRGYQQIVSATGSIVARSPGGLALPVDTRTRALARTGSGTPYLRSVHVAGMHLRVLAEPLDRGHAIQYAQSLGDVDHLLGRLRLILGLVALGGIVLAAVLARAVAGAALLPVKRLTQTAEHVTHTQDLSRRLTLVASDEIGRLAASFNAMLDALQRSMQALDASASAQRQLVADASHELRTPVTSLRTNIEFLQQADDIGAGERKRVLGDLVDQVEDLTTLMNDLIDLARGDERLEQSEDVRLDLLVGDAVERTRRRLPERPFELGLSETVIIGVPDRLARAVNNLLDNAVKYSPAGSPIELTLRDGELTVHDHGPGIPASDLAHVFDRFYRGADARGRPGSGLGLAIVRQVAEAHGGSVGAEAAPGGGTLVRLRLPCVEPAGEQAAGVAPDDAVLTSTLPAGA